MRHTKIICDICLREMRPELGWEHMPRNLLFFTDCNSQNPMERITKDKAFQYNEFRASDCCQGCMKSVAEAVATAIETLRIINP